ncbi:MAG: hypothetical protein KC668_09760 [Myxococcales bacterium]|nr:hypothetical protein [Myxococcales bacterium]
MSRLLIRSSLRRSPSLAFLAALSLALSVATLVGGCGSAPNGGDAGASAPDAGPDVALPLDGAMGDLSVGSACDASSVCATGHCVDGVCCETTCDGTCEACASVSTGEADGVCAPVSAGEDPDDECAAGPCGTGMCDGGGACAVSAQGIVCRAASGACDVQEVCDGLGSTCPEDAFVTSGTTCRAGAGACDVEEVCDGVVPECPEDRLADASTVCRAAAGACDVEETCTGGSAACPSDAVLPAATVCRAAAGPCDLTEVCTGSSNGCPSNAFVPAQTPCRDAVNACDVTDVCSGDSAACVEQFLPGAVADCAPYRCATQAPLCLATCTNNTECAPGAACLMGTCTTARRVFVTSTLHASDFGGLAAADAICQARAQAANLSGAYRAWLSDGVTSAASRLEHFAGPYYRVWNNVAEPVAANWADLTDGTLERTLGTTEFGQVRDRYEGVAAEFAWTGSTAAGLPVGLHCAGWTDSSTGRGATGNTGAINTTWSDLGNGLGVYCYHPARLYCIEQGAD